VITKSPFGLALKGLRDNEARIQMLGYNPAFIKIYAFALSGIFAGLAGILYAYYNRFVSPSTAGFLTSGKAVLMVILGGIGTLAGPVIGAVIITFVENVVSLSTARWPTVLGLLYIVSVLFARDGIAGLGRTVWARVSSTGPSRGNGAGLSTPAEVRRE
jgi:branched-chain amino acid transport system permease protein